MDDNYFLVYINEVGTDWSDKYHYEFLFCKDLDIIETNCLDYFWDVYPASGVAEKPSKTLIDKVGLLISDIHFDLIQNSDTFSYYDALDNVVSLGWQNLDGLEVYPEKRLFFKYGETFEMVKNKLYELDISFKSTFKNN